MCVFYLYVCTDIGFVQSNIYTDELFVPKWYDEF